MPVAVLAVHQLRYWLTYGPQATRELADQGHSYLSSLTPWIVMLAAVAAGAFLTRLAAATAGHGSMSAGPARRIATVWAATAMRPHPDRARVAAG